MRCRGVYVWSLASATCGCATQSGPPRHAESVPDPAGSITADAARGVTAPAGAGWRQHVGRVFSAACPEDWSVGEQTGPAQWICAERTADGLDFAQNCNVIVEPWTPSGDGTPEEEYWARNLNDLSKVLPSFTLDGTRLDSLDGHSAVRATFGHTYLGRWLTAVGWYAAADGYGVAVTCTAEPDLFVPYEATFDLIHQYVRLTDR
jgi:hypothetical protein